MALGDERLRVGGAGAEQVREFTSRMASTAALPEEEQRAVLMQLLAELQRPTQEPAPEPCDQGSSSFVVQAADSSAWHHTPFLGNGLCEELGALQGLMASLHSGGAGVKLAAPRLRALPLPRGPRPAISARSSSTASRTQQQSAPPASPRTTPARTTVAAQARKPSSLLVRTGSYTAAVAGVTATWSPSVPVPAASPDTWAWKPAEYSMTRPAVASTSPLTLSAALLGIVK